MWSENDWQRTNKIPCAMYIVIGVYWQLSMHSLYLYVNDNCQQWYQYWPEARSYVKVLSNPLSFLVNAARNNVTGHESAVALWPRPTRGGNVRKFEIYEDCERHLQLARASLPLITAIGACRTVSDYWAWFDIPGFILNTAVFFTGRRLVDPFSFVDGPMRC